MSYGRQLLPGTFGHALSYLIENGTDLGRFAERFENDETSAPAYAPAALLKVVLVACSRALSNAGSSSNRDSPRYTRSWRQRMTALPSRP